MAESELETYNPSPIYPSDEIMAPPLKKSPPKKTTTTAPATPP